MALTQEQRQKAQEYFKKQESQNYTVDGFLRNYSRETAPKPNVFERMGETFSERFSGIKETIGETVRGEISPLETGIRTVGDVIGTGFDLVMDVADPVIKPVIEGVAKTEVGKAAFEKLGEGMEAYEEWKQSSEINRRIGETLEGAVNITDIFGSGVVAKVTGRSIKAGKEILEEGVEKVVKGVGKARGMGNIIEGTAGVVETTKDVATDFLTETKDFLKAIPERTAIRKKMRMEVDDFIDTTPDSLKPLVKRGINEGIDKDDFAVLINATNNEKSFLKDLTQSAKKFQGNKRQLIDDINHPMNKVGQVLRDPIKKGNKILREEGKKLGEFARKIPKHKLPDIQERIVRGWQEIPGMEDLRLVDGKLDFSDTRLAGPKSKRARKEIQQEFDFVKNKNAYQWHLKRQNIFDELGGRKAAGIKVTAPEEKMLESMRDTLSNSIEKLSKGYQELNKTYAPMAKTKQKVDRFFKNVIGADEDILDMKAGLLARRLTSNTQSRAELLQILRELKGYLIKRGVQIDIDPVMAQEYLNIFQKYFDILDKTSFAGQVQRGIQDVTPKGIIEKVGSEVLEKVGPSMQSRQKVFEDFINNL